MACVTESASGTSCAISLAFESDLTAGWDRRDFLTDEVVGADCANVEVASVKLNQRRPAISHAARAGAAPLSRDDWDRRGTRHSARQAGRATCTNRNATM